MTMQKKEGCGLSAEVMNSSLIQLLTENQPFLGRRFIRLADEIRGAIIGGVMTNSQPMLGGIGENGVMIILQSASLRRSDTITCNLHKHECRGGNTEKRDGQVAAFHSRRKLLSFCEG